MTEYQAKTEALHFAAAICEGRSLPKYLDPKIRYALGDIAQDLEKKARKREDL